MRKRRLDAVNPDISRTILKISQFQAKERQQNQIIEITEGVYDNSLFKRPRSENFSHFAENRDPLTDTHLEPSRRRSLKRERKESEMNACPQKIVVSFGAIAMPLR